MNNLNNKTDNSEVVKKLLQMVGIHPLVAIGMCAIDAMLFGVEGLSAGLAIPATVAIALSLSIPCTLVQKYCFGDNWGGAIGKGLMVGIITAIPTPIPSFITGALGCAGTGSMLISNKESSEGISMPEKTN